MYIRCIRISVNVNIYVIRSGLETKRMNECMNKYCIVYKGLPVNPFTQY